MAHKSVRGVKESLGKSCFSVETAQIMAARATTGDGTAFWRKVIGVTVRAFYITLFCLFARGRVEVERIGWQQLGAFFSYLRFMVIVHVYKDVDPILSETSRSPRDFNLIPVITTQSRATVDQI
jgi:hypothetical protein